MKRILITGGTGNLGSHLVRQAIASGVWDEVHATYRNVNPNFQKAYWHLMDAQESVESTLEKTKPTHIVHTLAMSDPDECERRKLDAWQINVGVTKTIATYANQENARLIYTSSDLVFNGEKGNYAETDEPSPINFYGDTKLEAEVAVREHVTSNDYVIVRLANMYGLNLNQRPNFFSRQVDALKEKKKITLYTDQRRSMISLSDAAAGVLELADLTFEGMLHLGGEAMSRYDFGRRLAAQLKIPDKTLEPVASSSVRHWAKRPSDVTLNSAAAQKLLKTSFRGVEECLKEIFQASK